MKPFSGTLSTQPSLDCEHGSSEQVRGCHGMPVHSKDSRLAPRPRQRESGNTCCSADSLESPMRYPPHFLDDIRARLSVSQVVGRKVALKRAGREFKGLSPFKVEKTPSFTVNDQKGFYHCFASGEHGDIFTFLMKTEGLVVPRGGGAACRRGRRADAQALGARGGARGRARAAVPADGDLGQVLPGRAGHGTRAQTRAATWRSAGSRARRSPPSASATRRTIARP